MMIGTHSSEALRSTGLADRDVDKESAGVRTSNSQYQVSTKTARAISCSDLVIRIRG